MKQKREKCENCKTYEYIAGILDGPYCRQVVTAMIEKHVLAVLKVFCKRRKIGIRATCHVSGFAEGEKIFFWATVLLSIQGDMSPKLCSQLKAKIEAFDFHHCYRSHR